MQAPSSRNRLVTLLKYRVKLRWVPSLTLREEHKLKVIRPIAFVATKLNDVLCKWPHQVAVKNRSFGSHLRSHYHYPDDEADCTRRLR